MVLPKEESGMSLNKTIINRDYWDTNIKVREKCTCLLML